MYSHIYIYIYVYDIYTRSLWYATGHTTFAVAYNLTYNLTHTTSRHMRASTHWYVWCVGHVDVRTATHCNLLQHSWHRWMRTRLMWCDAMCIVAQWVTWHIWTHVDCTYVDCRYAWHDLLPICVTWLVMHMYSDMTHEPMCDMSHEPMCDMWKSRVTRMKESCGRYEREMMQERWCVRDDAYRAAVRCTLMCIAMHIHVIRTNETWFHTSEWDIMSHIWMSHVHSVAAPCTFHYTLMHIPRSTFHIHPNPSSTSTQLAHSA